MNDGEWCLLKSRKANFVRMSALVLVSRVLRCARVMLTPSLENEYVFLNILFFVCRSYCKGHPNKTCNISIGITSHHISFEYLLQFKNCTRHRWLNFMTLPFLAILIGMDPGEVCHTLIWWPKCPAFQC